MSDRGTRRHENSATQMRLEAKHDVVADYGGVEDRLQLVASLHADSKHEESISGRLIRQLDWTEP